MWSIVPIPDKNEVKTGGKENEKLKFAVVVLTWHASQLAFAPSIDPQIRKQTNATQSEWAKGKNNRKSIKETNKFMFVAWHRCDRLRRPTTAPRILFLISLIYGHDDYYLQITTYCAERCIFPFLSDRRRSFIIICSQTNYVRYKIQPKKSRERRSIVARAQEQQQ